MSDELIKVPTLEELSSEAEEALKDNNFIIKNFRNGGIFKTLMMIPLWALIGLYQLLAQISTQVFLLGAKGIWLDIKAAEYGISRKLEKKTEGKLVARRAVADRPVKIPAKFIIKTDVGSDGTVLRYLTSTEVVLSESDLSADVPVIAEFAGAKYNVATNMIKNPLKNIPGIDTITNESDWLTREGTDDETDDSLRARCLAVWDKIALQMTGDAYSATVKDINGVAVVKVDDQHPRGQGTIDIVVTGVAGAPTPDLLTEVRAAVDKVKGNIDDVLVIGATAVSQNVSITIYKDNIYGDAATIKSAAETALSELFIVNESNSGNKLTLSTINFAARGVDEKYIKDVVINEPTANVSVSAQQILTAGTITVDVKLESEAA